MNPDPVNCGSNRHYTASQVGKLIPAAVILRTLEIMPCRLKKYGPGCLLLLLAIGLGIWAARDLPRRMVAAVLSDHLGARVHLDQLEILGTSRLRLLGLSLASLRDYSFIETLSFEELAIEGSIRGVLNNRFERLRLRGVEARLAPAPAVTIPDRPPPTIGELILEPATIRIATAPGRDDLRLCLTATIRDIGKRTHGSVRLSAANLSLRPFFALAGTATAPRLEARLEDLRAELFFDADSSELTAGAESALIADRGATIELSRPSLDIERFSSVAALRLGAGQATAKLGARPVTVDRPSAEAMVIMAPDGTLRVGLVPQLGRLAAGHLEADWDPAAERLRRLEARLHGIEVDQLWPDSGLEAAVDVELHSAGDRLSYRLEIAPRRVTVAPDRQLRGLRGSTISIAGSLPFEPLAGLEAPIWDGPLAATIAIPQGQAQWSSLVLPPAALPLEGSFQGHWLDGETRRLSGSYRLESPAAGHLAADGEIAVQGNAVQGNAVQGNAVQGNQVSADLTWSWTGINLESLAGLLRHGGLSLPESGLRGSGGATGELRGPIGIGTRQGPAVRAELRLRQLEAAADGVDFRLTSGTAAARLSWAGGESPIELLAMHAAGSLTTPGLEPLDLTLEASGGFDKDLAHGRLEGTLRESPGQEAAHQGTGLGTAHVTGRWRRSAREISAGISLDAIDLRRWQQVAGPALTLPGLADFQLMGVAGADLEGTWSDGVWRLAGPAHLESAGFTSLDGSRVSEGLAGRWDLSVRGAPGSPIEARGAGRLGGFLLLWNTFFADFSQIEASLSARASIAPAEAGPQRWRLEVGGSLAAGPVAEATVESTATGLRYALSLDDHDLGATHLRYLAPLFEQHLGRIELGGSLAARGRGNYRAGDDSPASWSLIGGLRLTDLSLTSGGGQVTITGLDLDLPLDLRRRPSSETDFSGPRLAGSLAFDRLAVRGLELPPTDSDLSVEADSVGLEKPITLAVLGGAVTFEWLTLRHLLRPGRHLESGIDLAAIRLEKISDELELIPLEGALNGHLTGVRLSPSLLAVEGGGEIEVFGGTVTVRDISGQDVLSKFPKLKLSADFRDIDLGALTRRLDFGEMTGILEGTLEDCELFRGVPVRFSARLETLQRKGVPRSVDVKAINNITILGTGQRTSIFDRGIQRFFDRYNYQRLGVTMRLDRDVLLLRGLEHRGGRELFLRGRLPFRIDVVNAQPGKTVSFQTMVGRLRSLDFAGATTEP